MKPTPVIADPPPSRSVPQRQYAQRGARVPSQLVLLLIVLFAAACGDYSVHNDAKSLARLPADSETLRVRGIRDSEIHALERFKSVRYLDFLAGYGKIPFRTTATGFRELARLAPETVRQVRISDAPLLDDECLSHIASIGSLEFVRLARCPSYTRDGLARLLDLQNLRNLDICGCPQVDDDWVPLLSEFQALEGLNVYGTSMSSNGVEALRSKSGIPEILFEEGGFCWTSNSSTR